jgi:hypothetical protein
MYRDLALARGVTLDAATLDVLAEDRSSALMGCLFALIRWPFKKLFRLILYFLTVKDVLDAVAIAGHRATMVQEALEGGYLPAEAEGVRAAMESCFERIRWSPVSRLLWRYERPDPGFAPGEWWEVRFVRGLQRHGAAGLLLPEYRGRLEKLSCAVEGPPAKPPDS